MRVVVKSRVDQEQELRRKLLAKIHIARKEARVCKLCGCPHFYDNCPRCGGIYYREMSEIDYRGFLLHVTGKASCKKMDMFELVEVVRWFEAAGFQSSRKMDFREVGREIKNKMLKRLKYEARYKLGEDWQKRINGFVREKIGVSAIDFLDFEQLRTVWAFLRRIK